MNNNNDNNNKKKWKWRSHAVYRKPGLLTGNVCWVINYRRAGFTQGVKTKQQWVQTHTEELKGDADLFVALGNFISTARIKKKIHESSLLGICSILLKLGLSFRN